jgi:hypothetical protein
LLIANSIVVSIVQAVSVAVHKGAGWISATSVIIAGGLIVVASLRIGATKAGGIVARPVVHRGRGIVVTGAGVGTTRAAHRVT